MLGIAYHKLQKLYAERARRPIDVEEVGVHDLGPGPSTALARRAEQRLLLAGLRRLPLQFQVVLELSFWEDMTAGAIGAVLGEPEGTVRTRLRRAKELLAVQLRRLGAAPALLEEHPRRPGRVGPLAAGRAVSVASGALASSACPFGRPASALALTRLSFRSRRDPPAPDQYASRSSARSRASRSRISCASTINLAVGWAHRRSSGVSSSSVLARSRRSALACGRSASSTSRRRARSWSAMLSWATWAPGRGEVLVVADVGRGRYGRLGAVPELAVEQGRALVFEALLQAGELVFGEVVHRGRERSTVRSWTQR